MNAPGLLPGPASAFLFAFVLTFAAPTAAAEPAADECAQEDPAADVADVPAEDLRAGGEEDRRYFLIGAEKGAKPPDGGYGLLLVLPGGDGVAGFHAFVKRIYKHALPDGYLVAQLVAVPL